MPARAMVAGIPVGPVENWRAVSIIHNAAQAPMLSKGHLVQLMDVTVEQVNNLRQGTLCNARKGNAGVLHVSRWLSPQEILMVFGF